MMKKIALIFLISINSLLTAQNIDTTFGANGIVITNLGLYEVKASNQVIQPDGKILIVGYARINSSSPYQGIVIRFNLNGEVDTTFNAIGYKLLDSSSNSDLFACIKLLADGKILVGVRTSFQKLNSDGTYDISFGNNGIINEGVSDICIQPDGKILASFRGLTNNPGCLIARYNSNGIIDPTFGGSGCTPYGIGVVNAGGRINLFSNGQIAFLYGHGSPPGSFNGYKIFKLNADGSSTGLVISNSGYGSPHGAIDFTIDNNDNVIVISTANNIVSTKRYNSNFQIDTSFANNGVSTIFPYTNRAIFEANGKILILNRVLDPNNSTIVTNSLYRSNGNCTMIDSSFANGGILNLSSIILGYNKRAENISIFNQNIIVSGFTPTGSSSTSVFLTKINLNGVLDTEDINESETITMAPNPASDYVTIKTLEDDTDVKVYNSIGMLVKEIQVKKESTVNIEELETGLYFFKINSKIFKLIKK